MTLPSLGFIDNITKGIFNETMDKCWLFMGVLYNITKGIFNLPSLVNSEKRGTLYSITKGTFNFVDFKGYVDLAFYIVLLKVFLTMVVRNYYFYIF